MKTIALSEDTHKDLMRLKLEYRTSSSDKLLRKLIREHKKLKFLAASRLFREKTNGQSLKDISKEARKIREEVYAEWFKD